MLQVQKLMGFLVLSAACAGLLSPEPLAAREPRLRAKLGSEHGSAVTVVTFSPDGRLLATASTDRTIRIRDAADGRQITSLEGHTWAVWSISFSPDGKSLASASGDGTVRVWDVASAKCTRTFQDVQAEHLAFSPTGKVLATSERKRILSFRDATTGKVLATVGGFGPIAYTPDGTRIASAGPENTIRIWDVKTSAEVGLFTGLKQPVNSLAFSADGKVLVSGGGKLAKYTGMYIPGEVKLWDVASGKEQLALGSQRKSIRNVAISPDGKRVAASEEDWTLRLWDLPDGTKGKVMELPALIKEDGHRDVSRLSLAFRPDGRALAWGRGDSRFGLIDLASRKEMVQPRGHTNGIANLAFNPDGRTFASVGHDGTLRFWDAAQGRETRSILAHKGGVRGLAFSTDGKFLVTGGEDRTVKLWNTRDGSPIASFTGHADRVEVVAISPDSKRLASGSMAGELRVWEVASGKVLHENKSHIQNQRSFTGVRSLAFHPNGKRLASGGRDGYIRIWNLNSYEAEAEWSVYHRTTNGLVFSPDGKTLAAAYYNKFIVQLFDVASGKETRELKGFQNPVECVAFSPDGKTVVAGSEDKTVRLWDAETGANAATLTAHTSAVTSVAFSPDGKTFVTGCLDNTICIWELVEVTKK